MISSITFPKNPEPGDIYTCINDSGDMVCHYWIGAEWIPITDLIKIEDKVSPQDAYDYAMRGVI